MEQVTLILHGDNCVLVIKRFGCWDQSALHEYMYSDEIVRNDLARRTYFDNRGYDTATYNSKVQLLKDLSKKYAIVKIIGEAA